MYTRNRQFLPQNQNFQKISTHFNGTVEKVKAPRHCTRAVIFEMVENIDVSFGKPVKGVAKSKLYTPFKKKSIFYKCLDYQKELEVINAIDWMHIGKAVFDYTTELFLDLSSKTKDGLSARRDLLALGIRTKLHPQVRGNGKYYLPPASQTYT